MIELKYLKDLPIRPLNNNKAYLKVTGGDVYVDKDGNRYAYLSFKNTYKKPAFSLYLIVKEYDLNGTLIRENRQAYPSIYIGKQSYITEKPIKLTRDCEGLDVYIAYAEFSNIYFFNDAVTRANPKCLDEISPEAYCNIPDSVGSKTFAPVSETPVVQPKESVAALEAEEELSNEVEVPKEEQPVLEEEVQASTQPQQVVEEQQARETGKNGKVIRMGLKFNPAALIALAIAAAILLLVLEIALTFTK